MNGFTTQPLLTHPIKILYAYRQSPLIINPYITFLLSLPLRLILYVLY